MEKQKELEAVKRDEKEVLESKERVELLLRGFLRALISELKTERVGEEASGEVKSDCVR